MTKQCGINTYLHCLVAFCLEFCIGHICTYDTGNGLIRLRSVVILTKFRREARITCVGEVSEDVKFINDIDIAEETEVLQHQIAMHTWIDFKA